MKLARNWGPTMNLIAKHDLAHLICSPGYLLRLSRGVWWSPRNVRSTWNGPVSSHVTAFRSTSTTSARRAVKTYLASRRRTRGEFLLPWNGRTKIVLLTATTTRQNKCCKSASCSAGFISPVVWVRYCHLVYTRHNFSRCYEGSWSASCMHGSVPSDIPFTLFSSLKGFIRSLMQWIPWMGHSQRALDSFTILKYKSCLGGNIMYRWNTEGKVHAFDQVPRLQLSRRTMF